MQHTISLRTWTRPLLDSMRQQGDAMADACLATLRAEHGIEQTSALFQRLDSNDDQAPFNAPPAFQDFLAATGTLPEGTDLDRLKRGAQTYMTHAFPVALTLLAKSLPAGYAAPNLTTILSLSGQLERHPYKRTLGVLQMVINVANPRGFEPGGAAIITAQKLRLLHAGIRDIVRQLLPKYEPMYGVPVNQEDMLATVMGFSYLVIEGLRQLHAELSRRDEEDLYYLWRVFAELMGIDPDHIPEDVDDAADFYQAYARRHFVDAAHNPAGVKLAAADLRMMQQMLPRLLRWLGFTIIPRIYMNDLLGREACARVGIARVRGYPLLKWLLHHLPILWMQSWKAWDAGDPAMHEALSHLIFQGMINREYNGEVTFMIPETLADLRQLA
jgi:hypothetical protein